MEAQVSPGHWHFDQPDQWFQTISPYFVRPRPAQRFGPFSLTAHFEPIGGGGLFDVHIDQSGTRPDQQGFSVDGIETHPYFALLQLKGTCRLRQADGETLLEEGDWGLFDSNAAASFSAFDRSRTVGVTLSGDATKHWRQLVGPGGYRLPRCLEREMATTLVDNWLQRPAGWPDRIGRSFEALLLDLLESSFAEDSAGQMVTEKCPARLHLAKDFISSELCNPELRPEDISQAIGISRRALYRLFRQIGNTPMSYVQEQRLQEAAHRSGRSSKSGLTITNIAYDLGFADTAHFSRVFRKRFSMSPRHWARRIQQG